MLSPIVLPALCVLLNLVIGEREREGMGAYGHEGAIMGGCGDRPYRETTGQTGQHGAPWPKGSKLSRVSAGLWVPGRRGTVGAGELTRGPA
jgi:hypothetical protein